MKFPVLVAVRRACLVVPVLWLAACASTPPSAQDVMARAAKAMGADTLKSIRYAGEGEGFTFGQAYLPGGPWPKVAYHSVVRTVDYENAAMRDEIVLSRAEPRGGGGYPLQGQQRNDQFVAGELAWNVGGGVVAAGPALRRRPHPPAVDHAARRAEGGAAPRCQRARGRGRGAAAQLHAAGTAARDRHRRRRRPRDPCRVGLSRSGARRHRRRHDLRRLQGLRRRRFPSRVRQSAGGHPVLDLAVKEVQANAPVAALAVPEAARNQGERVVSERVADGVWFIAGGSHNSVLVEMADHLVLVETPLNDARTQAVLDHVKTLVPAKAIRYAVNSHAHFDHSGGVRAAVAAGATVVTMAGNVPYFETVLGNGNTLRPDRMAQAAARPRLQAVTGDKGTLSDGARTIELHKIVGGPHSDTMLMAYLPKERLLIQADAFTPSPPNTPPPATPNANNVNLIDNIERLKLSVERILPLHGRVVPLADLYATAGRAAPR